MEVTYELTRKDLKTFARQYIFERNLAARVLYITAGAVFIGWSCSNNHSPLASAFWYGGIALAVLITYFYLIPYFISEARIKKAIREQPLPSTQSLTTTQDGLLLTTGDRTLLTEWNALKNAEIYGDYIYIECIALQSFIIPVKYFPTKSDAVNFLGRVKPRQAYDQENIRKKKIQNLSWWGLAGIIPNFGVIAGIVLFIRGAMLSSVRVMLIGVADVLFTIVFWLVMMKTVFHSHLFDEGQSTIARSEMTNLVHNLEFYNLQHGQYPDSLPQLRDKNDFLVISDLFANSDSVRTQYFQYKRIGKKYTLFSVGPDGLPHTRDDVFPDIDDTTRLGWIKEH